MSFVEIALLISAGFLVGFINTLAGGATIISLSVLMFLGLPPNVANGTHRIAAFFQTFVSTNTFRQQKVLDFKKALWLGIPTAIGSLIGAYIAVDINEEIFEKAVAIVVLIIAVFLVYKPKFWISGQKKLMQRKLNIWTILLFFILGIYGGFIHIGIGYFLLIGIVFGAGYDLIKANAIKVMIVFLYIPFTLFVFISNDIINYKFGLVLAVGQVIGAYVGAKVAVKWGAGFVRWLMIIVILVLSSHYFGLINIIR